MCDRSGACFGLRNEFPRADGRDRFDRTYGLTQLSIEADGKEPSAASMRALVDEAREAGVRVVFVQQEFDRKHAESLAAEIGARIVTIHPLSADWKTEMLRIAESLATP